MSVYEKVLDSIKVRHVNGHALRNMKNIQSLKIAQEEIKEMFECVKK